MSVEVADVQVAGLLAGSVKSEAEQGPPGVLWAPIVLGWHFAGR